MGSYMIKKETNQLLEICPKIMGILILTSYFKLLYTTTIDFPINSVVVIKWVQGHFVPH